MSSTDKQRIVDINSHQKRRGNAREPLGTLLKACRDLALKRCGKGLESLFENVDDALFDMAEKAGSTQRQTAFFDGMRELRIKRSRMAREFEVQLNNKFSQFSKRTLAALQDEQNSSEGEFEALSLVEDSELEEKLAINGMVSKAENRLSRDLHALNKRLAVVVGDKSIESANNPVSPEHLADVFKISAEVIESGLAVKIVLFKQFEKFVMSGLGELYHALNERLSEAGILPGDQAVLGRPKVQKPYAQIRPRDDHPAQAGGEEQPWDAGNSEGQPHSHGEDAGIDQQLLSSLQGLLAQRRGPASGGQGQVSSGSSSSARRVDTGELLNALSLLQAEHSQSDESTPVDDSGSVLIKGDLLEQISKLAGSNAGGFQRADDDTIELVGMLFEFIHRDTTLPDRIKTMLLRLQVPMIKAALIDRQLLGNRRHPARLLLDELANAGIGWSQDADPRDQLIGQLRHTVDTVLDEFDDDFNVFARELDSFREFLGKQSKRAEVAEKRTAEKTRGQEQLQAARKRAAREVLSRLESNASLPGTIRALLEKPWANVLVLCLLRHGENSTQYKYGLAVMDTLIRSVMGERLAHDDSANQAALDKLGRDIRRGLDMVAYHDQDAIELLAEIRELQSDAQERSFDANDTTKQAVRTLDSDTSILGHSPDDLRETDNDVTLVNHAPDEPLESEKLVAAAAPHLANDYENELAQLKEVRIGTWFELTLDDSGPIRAKLSWISPISSKYLFVNRKGLKVTDITLRNLAADMREDRARILEEGPLFDRAMGAILENLKKEQPDDDQ
jgi:hypothetical protein